MARHPVSSDSRTEFCRLLGSRDASTLKPYSNFLGSCCQWCTSICAWPERSVHIWGIFASPSTQSLNHCASSRGRCRGAAPMARSHPQNLGLAASGHRPWLSLLPSLPDPAELHESQASNTELLEHRHISGSAHKCTGLPSPPQDSKGAMLGGRPHSCSSLEAGGALPRPTQGSEIPHHLDGLSGKAHMASHLPLPP